LGNEEKYQMHIFIKYRDAEKEGIVFSDKWLHTSEKIA
jgi:hypothetical protein